MLAIFETNRPPALSPGTTIRAKPALPSDCPPVAYATIKKRIKLAGAEHRLIAVGAGYDDHLVQDVVFNVRVRNDPINRRVVQEVPEQHAGE
jgi:hypothetical protein